MGKWSSVQSLHAVPILVFFNISWSFVNYCLVQLSSHKEGKITTSYPSGKRTALIVNEAHQKICKAILKSDKVEKTVLDVLTISNPDEVVVSGS